MGISFGARPFGSQFTVDTQQNFLRVGDGNGLGSGMTANQLARPIGYYTGNNVLNPSSSAQKETLQYYKGAPCIQLATGASGAPLCRWNFPAVPIIERPVGNFQVGTGFDVVSYRAVLAFGVTDRRAWFDFRLATSATSVPIVIAGAQAGFALEVLPDGAHFISRATDAGPLTDDTLLQWPVNLSDFALVEWRITNARPNADARVELFVNRVLLLQRMWGANTVLPDYTGKANAICFNSFLSAESQTAVNTMYVRSARYIAAPFDVPMY